jgi:hypothetical protein
VHDKLIVIQLVEELFVFNNNLLFIAVKVKARQGLIMSQPNAASILSFRLYDIHFNIISQLCSCPQRSHFLQAFRLKYCSVYNVFLHATYSAHPTLLTLAVVIHISRRLSVACTSALRLSHEQSREHPSRA